jgi:hypothetical protein
MAQLKADPVLRQELYNDQVLAQRFDKLKFCQSLVSTLGSL